MNDCKQAVRRLYELLQIDSDYHTEADYREIEHLHEQFGQENSACSCSCARRADTEKLNRVKMIIQEWDRSRTSDLSPAPSGWSEALAHSGGYIKQILDSIGEKKIKKSS